MANLILLRHGESIWNQLNLFTGWVDIPLSKTGIEQAFDAGGYLANEPIDLIFTSNLIRAQETLVLAMVNHSSRKIPVFINESERSHIFSEQAEEKTIPVFKSEALNERHYGDLQGLNKEETAKLYGKEQVQIWRRSYKTAPPNGESLEGTSKRTLPYFEEKIFPALTQGKNVLIVAHGNSLRSIIMRLDSLNEEEIMKVEIPLGLPLKYSFDFGRFKRC